MVGNRYNYIGVLKGFIGGDKILIVNTLLAVSTVQMDC